MAKGLAHKDTGLLNDDRNIDWLTANDFNQIVGLFYGLVEDVYEPGGACA